MDNTLTSVLAALGGSMIGATTPVLSNFALQRSLTLREMTNREIAQRKTCTRSSHVRERLATQRRFRRVWKTLTRLLRCTPW